MSPIDLVLSARYYEAFLLAKKEKKPSFFFLFAKCLDYPALIKENHFFFLFLNFILPVGDGSMLII